MISTLSTMTWDEEESSSLLETEWSLKKWLQEQAADIKQEFKEFREDVSESVQAAHASLDQNGNGTVSLSEMKLAVVKKARDTKDALERQAKLIEGKLDSTG